MNDALPASPAFAIEQELAAFDRQQETEPNPPPAEALADNASLLDNPTDAGDFNEDRQPSNPLFTSFADTMRESGASGEHLSAAHDWLNGLANLDGPLEAVPIRHGYTIRDYGFAPEDLPYAHHFLNAMSEAGASEDFVHQAIVWYLDSQDTPSHTPEAVREALQAERGVEALDRQDRDLARGSLRETWGEEFDANIALANQHLDRLPASQREFYESADDSGTLRLNRPEVLDRLAQDARSQVPPVLTEAAKQYGSQKIALEMMMANRNSPYWRGPDAVALQARYRDLLASGEQPKSLPQGSGIASEIASIEHTMRSDFHRYRRDERMQERYRQLLTLTGG